MENYYYPNEAHDWPLNKVCVTNQGTQVPVISLKNSEKDCVNMMVFSDIHFGQKSHNKDKFEQHLEWADERNAYFFLNGDTFEVAIPSRHEQSVWEIDMTTDEQYQTGYRYFYPRRDRVVGATSGNHDARVWKKTGFDIAKNFAKDLGCFYNKNGGYIVFNVGTQTYKMAFFHGFSAGADPFRELEKRLTVYDDADILVMGNNHHLGYRTVVRKRILDGEERRDFVTLIRTGGFLSEPEYSREALYSPTLEGAPMLTLNAKTKQVLVNVAGETLWT